MAFEWTDITRHARFDKDHSSHIWQILMEDGTAITVLDNHLMNPGHWTMHCYPLGFDTHALPQVESLEEAQSAAIAACQARVRRWNDMLSKLPGSDHQWVENGGWYACGKCGVTAGSPDQTYVCAGKPVAV